MILYCYKINENEFYAGNYGINIVYRGGIC
jgi:hypothetical protein